MEDFMSMVPPSHGPPVNLLVCLSPFGGDKIRFYEKWAPFSGCSTGPVANIQLFTSVRTLRGTTFLPALELVAPNTW